MDVLQCNKCNNIHERALWMVYQHKKFVFQILLKRDKFVSIHMKNHTYLIDEVVQVKNGHSSEITKEIFVFQENETYNIRSGNHLARNI